MSSAPTIPPLTGTVTVAVPVERAFRVFTDDTIGSGGGWTAILELFAKAIANQE